MILNIMWLYLWSIFIIGSVKSLTITYPYRPLLTYEPVRTQILDKSLPSQAFLVYLDNSGVERIVAYNYAEPVYAIRRISYINTLTPAVQAFTTEDNTDDVKAREAHFRAWSLHQYQILKHEIDLLKAEGKEPSIDMKLKFLPLEKIALTADFSTIAESPEIQRVRMEHLNIWKQIHQSYTNDNKDDSNNQSVNLNSSKANSEDSPLPKPIIKDLSVQNPENGEINIMQLLNGDKTVIEQLKATNSSDEFRNVEPEIVFANKIDTETLLDMNKTNSVIANQNKSQEVELSTTLIKPSKEDSEKSNFKEKVALEYQASENQKPNSLKDETSGETNKTKSEGDKIQITIDEIISAVSDKVKATVLQSEEMISDDLPSPLNTMPSQDHDIDNITIKEPQYLEKTTESVIPERSKDQLEDKNITKVFNNSFVREQQPQDLYSAEIVTSPESVGNFPFEKQQTIGAQKKVQNEVEKLTAAAPKIYIPQQVVDTDEVIRHRNEHLRIVNEALKKAKLAQEQYRQSRITIELPTTVNDATDAANADVNEKA